MSNKTSSFHLASIIPAVVTGMVGYHIHHSLFWAVMDFVVWPLALCKWLLCEQVTLSIVKETFAFFFR